MAASTSTKSTAKKTGKENAAPRGKSRALDEVASEDDEIVQEKKSSKSKNKRPLQEADDEGDVRELKKQLATVSAERDRLRSQKDTFAKQFEELSRLRSTEAESLLEKYKEKVKIQTDAQSKVIDDSTKLNDSLMSRVQHLEKSLAAAKKAVTENIVNADPKEVRALKDEIKRAKSDVDSKNNAYLALQKEYKTEIENSRSLQASTKSGPASNAVSNAGSSSEEAEKDTASLSLYEDLTLLNITSVKIQKGKYGNKEKTFNCVMAANGISLGFKLRSYIEIDKKRPADSPYVSTVHYSPSSLENESKEVVEKLGYFAAEFVIPREELGGFFLELRTRLEASDDDE
ncbi:hypothetical protein L202_05441 [Cryptococcus amylolentus CBS 6039]|uniref:Monopolin complex subunit Csm1/Pcs1 C-terminal domain-containing protein n=2 Tax=Cryptococcus amylolentus TaxID=104669 RepID=A0A1E3HKF9_9TREE|nr:hypothetical protein L202_05441 [Cryptococcus amylolentus CBS 6039]ODN76847.1 hypothetical protein L202_05441 [Cryptococcus amylolentus CBS 6039]ODO04760.1 hypothetical protein I350_05370 [Cryptococcus amylolentus CBS 6273]